jgi:fluoroacetyl-CoA thioesterase
MADFGALRVGMTGSAEWMVTPETSTLRWSRGSAGGFPERLATFATPDLVHLLEKAATNAVDPHLAPGWMTVGVSVQVQHRAPTPVGYTVTATATLIEIDRRRLVFRVEARDELEPVADGTHQRFVVDIEQLAGRLRDKAARKTG